LRPSANVTASRQSTIAALAARTGVALKVSFTPLPSKLPMALLAVQTRHGGGQAVKGVLDGLGVGVGVALGDAVEAAVANGERSEEVAGCIAPQPAEIRATATMPISLAISASLCTLNG
jgi:hypothetical protein